METDEAEPLIDLSWEEVTERIAKRKRDIDGLELGYDLFPGGTARFDYLRLLALRLAQDSEIRAASPWFHHVELDITVKRNGVIDNGKVVVAHPLQENFYQLSILENKSKSETLGIFSLEESVQVIKKTLRLIEQNP